MQLDPNGAPHARRISSALASPRGAGITTSLDSQQAESLRSAALTAAIAADDLEVARPERDAGIDLIAFSVKPCRVMPSAARGGAFSDRHWTRGLTAPSRQRTWFSCSRPADQCGLHRA